MSAGMGDQAEAAADNAPTFFREHAEFHAALGATAQSAGDADSWALPDAPDGEDERIRGMCAVLETYQEQPVCLDPHLERIVSPLMAVVQAYVHRCHDAPDAVSLARLDGVFGVLYTLCKVRSYKVVLRFFPHDVADVEPAFTTLWRCSADFGASSWKARYVLLVWLSLLAMVPFDIESLDSGLRGLPPIDLSGGAAGSSLAEQWVAIGKLYLARPGCDMDGAAVMLARLLSRKDTAGSLRPAFIEWAVREVREAAGTDGADGAAQRLDIAAVLRVNGALRALSLLLAAMDSVDGVAGHIEPLLAVIQSGEFEQHPLTRKLVSKTAQRLALLMLPPPTAAAAGRLNARPSVRANLDGGPAAGPAGMRGDTADDAAAAEVPEAVETIVAVLLQALHDKDTIVRWSAAKGVGRIAERLPRALAQEVAAAVVGVLEEETLVGADGAIDVAMTAEASWHGALLCLAELSRRGLLFPDELRRAVPWVVRGLTYEIQRGNCSVGANVRDAACYVMWSLARIPNAATRDVFAEMSTHMATSLISVAVFDRESSVRRAASAAFQEHVGRQGAFPHGIAVLQLADFFSVGVMRSAFVVASKKIAAYDEYRRPLIRHLCTNTIYHWDVKTRELAVSALAELAPLDADYVRAELLPGIVSSAHL
ncbi:hypothetical protein IWQ57_003756 [Coemansia nantahalensis]|uniref:Uncharacterized protein n=1 Tax=Coemansia nantahalensis TaxID=2789366 RepID=A0ACC1JVB7_9FUNG|nr:hypothetical protein IWQ57_003756 [Coemansia nantahalensis]